MSVVINGAPPGLNLKIYAPSGVDTDALAEVDSTVDDAPADDVAAEDAPGR